ncbi:MAG: hemolysin family protein [Alphaproteobacteria bacterium]
MFLLLLIILNGFFALSEMALVSARRGSLKRLAERGSRGAKAAMLLTEDPSRLLSTVQVGLTLTSVLAGTYSGARLSAPLGNWLLTKGVEAEFAPTLAMALVVGLVSYATLIIGELVPKRLALLAPERISTVVAMPMRLVARVSSPVIWVMRASTEAVLKLFRITHEKGSKAAIEEVRALVAEGTEAGLFNKVERGMVEEVLNLGDRPVRAIMTPRHEVVWLDIDAPPEEIRTTLLSASHSRFLVSKEKLDEVVGVVLAKEVLNQYLLNNQFDLMACVRPPLTITENTPVLKLLEIFRSSSMHFALVVDEYGGLEGVVTPADILMAIAGDLTEAGTPDTPQATEREDGSWLVDGRMLIDEVERALAISDLRSDDDYSTIAGFVLHQLKHIPKASEHFFWRGHRFEIVDMDKRRVDKILINLNAASSEDHND